MSRSTWRRQGPTRLYRCDGCGAIFNARSRSRAEEEAIYDTYTEAAPRGDDRIAATQWRWVRDLVAQPGAVLDVGCGYGAFLAQAQADGWHGAGVELDPRGAAACRDRGLDVRHGSLFDLRTGKPKTLPAYQPVKTFPVEVIDDTITLEV